MSRNDVIPRYMPYLRKTENSTTTSWGSKNIAKVICVQGPALAKKNFELSSIYFISRIMFMLEIMTSHAMS